MDINDKNSGDAIDGKDTNSTELQDKKTTSEKPQRGIRFWTIIVTLCTVGLLGAFENTVVATSLSFITRDLDMGDNYVWVTNAFFLTRYD